ncbi:HopJ type III effector protein [Oleispira antarctica]|uniref:HopJ type III effector protein n=1 Tax=Oleispira antarctica TaxID=188908 RepID=A0A1Y5HQP2_OLEAN|nr:HopJ type III effector protein [Oleispira antarctica]
MSQFEQAKTDFLQQLQQDNFVFETTLEFIETHFNFTPSAFNNGGVLNSQEQNQGSCKVFSLAQLFELTQQQALCCFGQHYRDVLATPEVDNHHNLRRVLKDGLGDISFDQFPLEQKADS